jgi:carbon monoxide dehydrogenase subunit G
MRVSRSRRLDASAEEVWRVISDPYRLPAWWPGVERVEEVSEAAWTKVLRAPKAGKTVRADYSVADVEPLRRLSWRHEVAESPFERIMSEALYDFDLQPDDGGTKVVAAARVRLRGLSRLGALQVRHATGRRLQEALESLAEVVE